MNRLVILDDDASIADFVGEVARSIGFLVETAHDAAGFQAALATGDPDVVILDLNLPGASGADMLTLLGRRGSKSRIFVMSGSDSFSREAAMQFGRSEGLAMQGHIPKPVRVAELRRMLKGEEAP
jgi:DNA-binding response OmpR family regulator